MVSIRPYEADDLDGVIEVFMRAIRETAARDYAPAQVAAWGQVDREAWRVRRLSRPTWVAVAGGTIAGFSDLTADGHLDMMFVHPDWSRRGVATTLLATVEQAARAQGIEAITTEASLTAQPFFARHGFAILRHQEVEIRGVRLANARMRKPLAPVTPA